MAGGEDIIPNNYQVARPTDPTWHLQREGESGFQFFLRKLVATRSFDSLENEAEESKLRRALGVWDLTSIGVGAIIGTGIFVLGGIVAHEKAGPGVVISYVIAAVVSGFAALSYAEMACMIPIAGSAYTYTYATCGELFAWIIGWDLILEYMVGAAAVSVGFAKYLRTFFVDIGWDVNAKLMGSPFIYKDDQILRSENYFSIPSFVIIIVLTIILCLGIRQSANVNNILVVIKLVVVIVFIFGSAKFVNTDNLKPFIPPNEDSFGKFGISGVVRGATVVFFSYIGFDAISTAAQEARHPQRDLPISIGVSLIGCTVLYIGSSIVMTGVVNYKDIHDEAAFALVARATGQKWLMIFCEVGILAGLASVMLIMLMGQPRIFFSMAVDGLFPRIATYVHPKFKTPIVTTAITGIIVALAGGFLPVDLLADMTSVGTLFAFFLVHCAVLILRWKQPDRPRRFKIPLGPVFPSIGAILCIALIAVDAVSAIIRLFVWLAIGLVIYFFYGRTHSRINNPHRYPDVPIETMEIGEGKK